MSNTLIYIIVILGIINLLVLVPMTFTFQSAESILSVSIYYRVWHIENLNILGKVLLTIIIIPFTILAELLIWCVLIGFTIIYYIFFRVCWLFAVDRDTVVWEWLGYEYRSIKHKFIMYVKDSFNLWK